MAFPDKYFLPPRVRVTFTKKSRKSRIIRTTKYVSYSTASSPDQYLPKTTGVQLNNFFTINLLCVPTEYLK